MAYTIGEIVEFGGRLMQCVPKGTRASVYRKGAYWVYSETVETPVLTAKDHEYYQRLGEDPSVVSPYKYAVSTPHYTDYYPGGLSDCIADQKCRGNPNARDACLNLFNGDASGIKREAGMSKSVLGDWLSGDKCSEVFRQTRLGPKMQKTAMTSSVVEAVVSGGASETGGGVPYIPEVEKVEDSPAEAEEREKSIWQKLNPCSLLCEVASGDEPLEPCGTFDVGCKARNFGKGVSTTVIGKTCYAVCIGLIGIVAAVLILFAIMGKKKGRDVIVIGAETGRETAKAAKEAAK